MSINFEAYTSFDWRVSTVEAQNAVLAILEQCTGASEEEIHKVANLLDMIFTAQWDNWEAFTPHTSARIASFVNQFWDETNVANTKMCCDLILYNYMYSHIHLLSSISGSTIPFVHNYALTTLHALTSYTTRTEFLFSRFNTVLLISGEHLSLAEKASLLRLRDSVSLSSENLTTARPEYDLLGKLSEILGSGWADAVSVAWLRELQSDYRALFDHIGEPETLN